MIHRVIASQRRVLRAFHSSSLRSSMANKTFVSKYYELDDHRVIDDFLRRKNLVLKETPTHYIVRDCPFCHSTKGRSDNLFKLYVAKTNGVYLCHRCGSSGSWFSFRQKLGASDVVPAAMGNADPSRYQDDEPKLISVLDNAKAIALQRNLHEDEECKHVLEYLSKRGLKPDVLKKYCVGAIQQPFYDGDNQVQKWCVTFPWMARSSDLELMGVECQSNSSTDANLFNVVRLKVRAIDDKSKQRLVPKGGSWGLFGWNTVPTSSTSIVITEGEFDAMAVYQATGLPSISLPNGCRSLPPAVLPLLERFTTIYLWMDNDVHGQDSLDKFVNKLGVKRTYVVRSQAKDANDALLSEMNLKNAIDNAERKPHAQIATFEQLRQDVLEELMNPLRASGVQSRTLPALNTYMKGFRNGEVTVLTGPTGCGKTTLLSQLSIDWCAQGVSTLWGSFEIKNTRLVHKMLTQMAGQSLSCNLDLFEKTADAFEQLPMYFLRFFGSTDVDEVIDAMEYAVYAYDVQHILLDNIQFMMSGQGRGYDKFERQDSALDKFRKFATAKNVHITLVVHPRKEQDDTDLSLSSVFGTAKATQEADNVLILQRVRGEVKLDVRKNRFDGTLGSIPLKFHAPSNCLVERYATPMNDSLSSIDAEVEMRQMQHSYPIEAPRPDYSTEIISEPSIPLNGSVNGSLNGTTGVNGSLNGIEHDGLNGYHQKVHKVNGHHSDDEEPFSVFTPIITK
ncbi:twinkle protein [Thraustotheca clavata]|uniref:Twinkle protein n=1 Tax=Thraustotheca clavata TaxID=74557 RepID=A0A1V9ZFE9_9STRA|nr:twinkle protein [Thraustotheca clavata]